jgi:hypothetical protein
MSVSRLSKLQRLSPGPGLCLRTTKLLPGKKLLQSHSSLVTMLTSMASPKLQEVDPTLFACLEGAVSQTFRGAVGIIRHALHITLHITVVHGPAAHRRQ